MAFIVTAPSALLSQRSTFTNSPPRRTRQHRFPAAPAHTRRCTWRATADKDSTAQADADAVTTRADTGTAAQNGTSGPFIASTQPPPPPPPVSAKGRADAFRGHVVGTLSWVGVAAACIPVIGVTRGWEEAIEFVTAYVVEYSLSVDNLFVFLLIFTYFNVPEPSQERVLGWGIFGAMVMRGFMILTGAELTRRFEVVTLLFAALLLFSAGKLLLSGGEDDEGDLSDNSIVRFARSLVNVSATFDGERFFTIENGMRMATPLFLVLLCVEFSDVVFALDSVPAVLGISDDTVVIYLSNILAIQGLRNLFFILSDSIGNIRFLSQALAVVLGFVGCKMIASVGGVHVPILPSLGIIVGTLGAGVGLSFAFPESDKAA